MNGFIRVLWGSEGINHRWPKVRQDVLRQAELGNQQNPPATAMVYGEANYELLRGLGFNAVLMHPAPDAFPEPRPDGRGSTFQHKTAAWVRALTEVGKGGLGFERMVFLDWDIWPIGKIDAEYVFRRLAEKHDLQANLLQYRRNKCFWRNRRLQGNRGKQPSAAFVYIARREIAVAIDRLLSENDQNWTEETAMAKYVDDLGGWKHGYDYVPYWQATHEPFCCRVRTMACCGEMEREHLWDYGNQRWQVLDSER